MQKTSNRKEKKHAGEKRKKKPEADAIKPEKPEREENTKNFRKNAVKEITALIPLSFFKQIPQNKKATQGTGGRVC
jgi:hypothetical protein